MSNLSALGLASVYDLLTGFAHLDNFWGLFETAFGTQYDRGVAEGFRSQWLAGDFGQSPSVEVVSGQVLGTANGAYAASTNTIYLSDRFVATASSQSLIAVLLEEFGHFVDDQVNTSDSAGDEGAIFSALVLGESLDAETLQGLKVEDDSAIIVINGEAIAVEQSSNVIKTATGDGGLQVKVDEFGRFGFFEDFGDAGRDAFYDPLGSKSSASTVAISYVALGIIGTNGTTGTRTKLAPSASNNEAFTTVNNTTANSTFTVGGLQFQLKQIVQDTFDNTTTRTGSQLDQTYTITNTTTQTINFDLVRYVDGDLFFDGTQVDAGGRIFQGGQEILFETDAGGTGQTDTTFFGILGLGGTIPTTNRWELDYFGNLNPNVSAGNILRNTIIRGDSNSDQFIDRGAEYDVALALRNVFSLAPGQSTTYLASTRFGSGQPAQLDLTPPTGGISILPAITLGNNINVTWSATDPSGIKSYDVFVSVNNGTFTPWLTGVATTSAVYVGEQGKTYSFYSLATDNAGNKQLATDAAKASTLINPVPGTLSFTANEFTVNENGTILSAVTVTRTGGSNGAVSATINLKDGTAKAPSDYNNTAITVNFADGQVTKTVNIPIVNDTLPEPDETVQLILTNPTGGATIGQQNTATLTIIDNDSALLINGFPEGSTGSNKGKTTIVISGRNFSPNDQISIIAPNNVAKAASKTYWVNDKEVWATFDLTGLTTGNYDVKIANGVNTAISTDTFAVTNGVLGDLKISLSYRANGVVKVTYTNVGKTDIVAPLLRVTGTNATVTYPEENTVSATLKNLLNLSLGTNSDGPAGILTPGASGEFFFNYTANGNGLISFAVNQVPADEVINWGSIKAETRADYSYIDAAGWDAIWSNLTANLGTTAGQFQAVMAEDANYLSQLGEDTSDLTRLFAFEWKQAVNTLTNVNLISTTDVVDAAPGLSLTFNRTFYESIAERYNLGTLGRGWASQWDLRATTDSKGNVIIRSVGDLQRVFDKQTNGTYTETGGATLTIVNSQYRLKEANGLISLFGTDGKLNYVEDTNSNRITLQYTGNNLTKLVHTNGDSLTLAYNAQGRINTITDSAGQVTTYSYDTGGEHLLSVAGIDGTTTYAYDIGTVAATKHSLLSVKSDLGYQRSFEYDNQGRLTKEFSNGNTQTLTYSYDSVGGVTITDSTGAVQTVLLDDRGNGGQIRGVNNQNLVFSYDADGNLLGATLPNNSQTAYSYDANGNLTQQTNLLGQRTNFTYDATFNQLTSFADPKGNKVSYSYDTKGDLTKITYVDGSTQQFSLDALGNVTSYINRRGSTIAYTYNNSGLLTKKQYANGSNVTYSYDTRGNLTSVLDATGTIALQYDTANQLTKITYPTGRSLTYTYNADGQRTKLVSGDGYTVNYNYDAVGRLKTLTNATSQNIISYDYDGAGRLTKETNGNGTYTTYEYDLQDQLTKLVNYKANNTVNSSFQYVYDNLGRRTSMTTLDGTFQYGYDAIGQLTSVVTPANRTINYQYDAAGNRIGVTDNGTVTNYTTNNLNEYTNVGNATYTYDKDGNLSSKTQGGETTNYTYDAENRLIKVITPLSNWEYQYDALGNRVATVLNGQRTEYLLDPTGLGDIVGEYSGSTLVANYTHGIGLVSRVNGSNSNYYDADAIGSTVGLTATDGSYVNKYSYLPFGEDLTKVEAVANPFEYVGQWGVTDEGNGLDFMRARFYDSGLGRFTSVDPIGVNGGDTNLYRYSFNSSNNLSDPNGLQSQPVILVVFHYGRNIFNEEPNSSTDVLTPGSGWVRLPPEQSIYHQQGVGNENNTKWVKQDKWWFGSSEAVLTPDGRLVTDSLNGGTYNFFDPSYLGGIPHGIFDVVPYFVLGNSPDDFLDSTRFETTFNQLVGSSYNDPHLNTLDGLGYDFQAVGEFTLVKSTTDDFEIQTRQQPWGTSTSASANTAVAVKIGGQRIAFYANQTNALLINGTAVTLTDGALYAVGQNLITRSGDRYDIITANNDLIRINNRGTFLNINLGLADNRKGKVVGLLGNYNGNRNDDFALRNGTAIGGTITDAQLYGDYGNSWRITPVTSLFDYATGQNTLTFTNLAFPNSVVTSATLTPAQRAAAIQVAQNAGITDASVLEDAILDIFITNGDAAFIQGATNQQRVETITAPNTLLNPDGSGTQHWLTSSAVIPYTIRFSNNAAQGTTPVAQVTITQTLDADLDLNTLTLNDINFGTTTLTVPTGTQNYSKRLDLRTTRGVFVDVNAGINTTTRVLTWTFTAIDPTTGNPANTATQGFLPPNDTNGVGQGSVGYSIQGKANIPNNTRIDAQASITFNSQTPIQTNPVFNTLELVANNAPTNFAISSSSIAENQAIGTVVGNLSTTDPDAGNTFTYSLVLGTGAIDNSLFTITNNQLKTNAIFDFETKNNYNIRIRTTDQGELFFEKELAISVSNVNENPTALILNNNTIDENQVIGTVISNFTTLDPDIGNTFTYSLVTGTGSTDNASFTLQNNQLKTNAVFDFETKNSYSIRLKTIDQGGLFLEKAFTINIGNINEAPSNLTLSKNNIAENQPIDTFIANLTTTDLDIGNTFTYSLVTGTGSTDNALFTIQNDQLKSNASFDYEANNSYSIRIKTTDQVGLSFEKAFTINITDLSDTIYPDTIGNIKLVKDIISNNIYAQSGNLKPITIKYSNQPIYENIYPGWETIAAETINGQNQVLWKNASINSIIVWKTDNNWNYQTSDGVLNINSLQALNQETAFQIDLNNDGNLGNVYSNLESQGTIKLVKDSLTYLYSQSGNLTPISIKYLNQPIYQNIYSGWQTLAAETINGQNQVLWKNASTNSIIVWKTDNNWNYQASEGILDINSLQALNQETAFQIDLNNDGNLGNTYSNLESQGTIKLLKDSLTYLYSQSGNLTPITLKYFNQLVYENNFPGWQAIAAETINSENQILWKNVSQNLIIIWKLDNNWNYQSADLWSINSSQALAQETNFQIDLNGDSKLGNAYSNLESQGNQKLIKDTLGTIYSQTGNQTPIAIKYVNQLITDNTYPGWQAIAAETINGQNQVLWKNASQNLIIIWKLDNTWNYQSADLWSINSSQALAQETNFQIDLNGDGKLGNAYSNLESQGNQKLIKDTLGTIYSQTGNLTPIAIKYVNQLITDNTYPGWQAIAAETINGQNQVLWKNASQNLIIIWKLDNTWNYQSADLWSINSSESLAQETNFQIDLNGDGKLGNAYSNLESQGNQKLIKDTLGTIYSQTGNQTPIAIKYANQSIAENTYPGWQAIAAETINSENQILWKNVSQNLIIIWKLDNNWNYQSADLWSINSSQALAQETVFGVDINGDSTIGNPAILNLVGTSSNDILVGGAKNDILTGAGGKDTLTGGGGSDRFDYKNLSDSLLANFDVVTDFNANPGNDLLLVTTARSGFTNAGAIAALTATEIGAKLTTANFAANSAAQFTVGTRTFVAINDAAAGFSATTDAIVEVTGLAGTLGLNNFTTL